MWKQSSNYWETRKEELTPGGPWLVCWRRPDGYTPNSYNYLAHPYGWVRVYAKHMRSEWAPVPVPLLEYRLEHGTGLLELECVAHEIRKEYSAIVSQR